MALLFCFFFFFSSLCLTCSSKGNAPERTLQLPSSVGVCSVAQLDETRVWLGLSTGELQQLSLKTFELSEPWRAHRRRIAQLLSAGDVVWSSGDNDTIIWDVAVRTNSSIYKTLYGFHHPFTHISDSSSHQRTAHQARLVLL